HLACDMDWHHLPTSRGWVVIYMAGEDEAGAVEMYRAWRNEHKRKPAFGRFIFIPQIVNLLDRGDVDAAYAGIKPYLADYARVVVILDTWQRAISGADKNDSKGMSVAVHVAVDFAKRFNGPVVCAFHPPKGNLSTTAGAAEQEDMSHAIWNLAKDN